jgi:hypothetical protein
VQNDVPRHRVVHAALANVYLSPAEAAVLPATIDLLYGTLKDVEQAARDQPFAPLVTARYSIPLLDPFGTIERAKEAAAWLAEILAFATRRPVSVLSYTTLPGVGDMDGESWEGAGPLRFARRSGGPRMFALPGDLGLIADNAWEEVARGTHRDRGLRAAVVWLNLTRAETELEYLDIQLLHTWIPLELLATHWAVAARRDRLLGNPSIKRLKAVVGAFALEEGLDDWQILEANQKVSELARRPTAAVILEFVRETLASYSAQPLGSDLEKTVRRSLKARNTVAHTGVVDFDAVGGVDLLSNDMRQIVALTEKVVLALLDARISLLTDVPWTHWLEPR